MSDFDLVGRMKEVMALPKDQRDEAHKKMREDYLASLSDIERTRVLLESDRYNRYGIFVITLEQWCYDHNRVGLGLLEGCIERLVNDYKNLVDKTGAPPREP